MSSGDAHRWYNRAAWRKRQAHQLRTQPLCAFCLKAGRITPATCVDHVEPHRGDFNKFVLGVLQSLCAGCHSGPKATIEKRGYDPTIGADGMPVDSHHPVYQQGKRL